MTSWTHRQLIEWPHRKTNNHLLSHTCDRARVSTLPHMLATCKLQTERPQAGNCTCDLAGSAKHYIKHLRRFPTENTVLTQLFKMRFKPLSIDICLFSIQMVLVSTIQSGVTPAGELLSLRFHRCMPADITTLRLR